MRKGLVARGGQGRRAQGDAFGFDSLDRFGPGCWAGWGDGGLSSGMRRLYVRLWRWAWGCFGLWGARFEVQGEAMATGLAQGGDFLLAWGEEAILDDSFNFTIRACYFHLEPPCLHGACERRNDAEPGADFLSSLEGRCTALGGDIGRPFRCAF